MAWYGGSRDVSDAVILDITCRANLALFHLLWVAPEVEEVSSEQAPQHLPAPPTLHRLQWQEYNSTYSQLAAGLMQSAMRIRILTRKPPRAQSSSHSGSKLTSNSIWNLGPSQVTWCPSLPSAHLASHCLLSFPGKGPFFCVWWTSSSRTREGGQQGSAQKTGDPPAQSCGVVQCPTDWASWLKWGRCTTLDKTSCWVGWYW